MTTASPSKSVAVIGAGPSGLVTIKELLAEGHRPTGFEKAHDLGGVFLYAPEGGVVWESCRLTSSGLLTAFSDFPASPAESGHMTIGEYLAYLRRYADAFGVTRHLRLGTQVEAVKRHPDGGWTVRSVDARGPRGERYDAVAICSGLNQHPQVPRFPGQDTFTGTIIHGAQYRTPAQVAGKTVLVVGAGESGADVVAEVTDHAATTLLSLRRGVGVQQRNRFGKPADYRTTRLSHSAAHWVFQSRNPRDDWKRSRYRLVFLPLVVIDKLLQLIHRACWEYLPIVLSGRVSETWGTRKLVRQLLAESGGVLAEQFGTKSDAFVRAMVRGRCHRRPAIARFDGPRVWFEDESQCEPDLVVLCTGFEARTPMLAEPHAPLPRYLHTFDPEIGASLAFIGFVRPARGALAPLAELQARWFARLQSERCVLPPASAMRASIAHWAEVRAQLFRPVAERLPLLVDYTSFCDELAGQVGCKPKASVLRQESRSFRRRFFAAPFVAAQYRLVGPHANPELARDVIGTLPILHSVPERINFRLRWWMSRVLHRLFGPEFAPKLTLD